MIIAEWLHDSTRSSVHNQVPGIAKPTSKPRRLVSRFRAHVEHPKTTEIWMPSDLEVRNLCAKLVRQVGNGHGCEPLERSANTGDLIGMARKAS